MEPNAENSIPHLVADNILRWLPYRERTKLLLVCKSWSISFSTALYQTPILDKMNSFELLMGVLNISLPYHPYPFMIQKLDISGIAADNIYMGDLDFCLKSCSNLQIFRLERCYHISNILIQSIATHCTFLQTLELPGCPISDTFIPQLSKRCKFLQKIDFSQTNVTTSTIYHLIHNCPRILDINLSECKDAEKLPDLSSKGPISPLQHINLRNSPVTDPMIRYIATQSPYLKTLILESCSDISDSSIMKVANSCLELETVDLSFCNLVTDLSIQVFAIRASNNNGGKLKELHLCACDSINPSTIHQFVQKAKQLELLVLDGCERMSGSFVKEIATYKDDDITCTFESKDLQRLASLPLEKSDIQKAAIDQLNPPPAFHNVAVSYHQKELSEPNTNKPSGLSRRSSKSLLNRWSMIHLNISPKDAESFVEMQFEERANKIRESKSSKAFAEALPKTNIDSVIERGRRLSIRRSMIDMKHSPKRTDKNRYVIPQLQQKLHFKEMESNYDSITEENGYMSRKPRPKSTLSISSIPFESKQMPPAIAQDLQHPTGHRKNHNRLSSVSSTASFNTLSRDVSQNSKRTASTWGQDPEIWNNPTQLTANSSTWSQKYKNNAQTFVDPWATNSPSSRRSVHSWHPSPNQTTPLKSNYGWSNNTFEKPLVQDEFQFSQTNRGRLLIKLKVETTFGGHQDLPVHEYDDPTKLANEFCQHWKMNDYKVPLIRLITLRKNNALRSKH